MIFDSLSLSDLWALIWEDGAECAKLFGILSEGASSDSTPVLPLPPLLLPVLPAPLMLLPALRLVLLVLPALPLFAGAACAAPLVVLLLPLLQLTGTHRYRDPGRETQIDRPS